MPALDSGERPSRSRALACEDIGLVIGGATILRNVTCEVAAGEFVAMIGPNGAGKTSLLNVISGTMQHTSGRVLVDGEDVSGLPIHRRARLGVGRTFQSSYLLEALSVVENVRLAIQAQRMRKSDSFKRVDASQALREECYELLERVGLTSRDHWPAGKLSHGEKRKLELAMVLAADASLILLDEPMAGVNADDVDGLVELIRQVHQESSATIVMVEHHMDVVLGLAERIAVMHHGSLLAFASPGVVMADQEVQTAYLGDPL